MVGGGGKGFALIFDILDRQLNDFSRENECVLAARRVDFPLLIGSEFLREFF
jgi:hypothetical protein